MFEILALDIGVEQRQAGIEILRLPFQRAQEQVARLFRPAQREVGVARGREDIGRDLRVRGDACLVEFDGLAVATALVQRDEQVVTHLARVRCVALAAGLEEFEFPAQVVDRLEGFASRRGLRRRGQAAPADGVGLSVPFDRVALVRAQQPRRLVRQRGGEVGGADAVCGQDPAAARLAVRRIDLQHAVVGVQGLEGQALALLDVGERAEQLGVAGAGGVDPVQRLARLRAFTAVRQAERQADARGAVFRVAFERGAVDADGERVFLLVARRFAQGLEHIGGGGGQVEGGGAIQRLAVALGPAQYRDVVVEILSIVRVALDQRT